ncbi:S-adenosyl-L-methionine-dependent methyltransferase [Thozetella sp. PMI_491]|nr:S-adenosyl-L-methionine-dependent methyltransferase [Thozetella sp. PMI_491]
MATADRTQYEGFAPKYTTIVDLPCSKIEAQLIGIALGDCTGLTVLDLGGGSGLHARRAVDAGAAVVDVFDISPEMMRIGEDIETQLGRQGRIRWFKADATRSLAEQVDGNALRSDGYDIVMANWVFDHATSMEDLRGMWENVVAAMKPGGRFLGVRVQSVRAKYVSYGKYGVTFTEVEEIDGGVRYQVGCLTEEPFSFEGTSMESSYTLVDDIPRELGLVGIQTVRPEETDIVKGDMEFWDEFLKDPSLAVVVAKKP